MSDRSESGVESYDRRDRQVKPNRELVGERREAKPARRVGDEARNRQSDYERDGAWITNQRLQTVKILKSWGRDIRGR